MNHNGKGNFIFDNETSFEMPFTFNWSSTDIDKKPILQINATASSLIFLDNPPTFPWRLKGHTTEDELFSGDGLALRTISHNINEGVTSISFSCNTVNIGNEIEFDYIDFYIPNVFIGFDSFESVDGRETRNFSYLELEYNQEIFNVTFSGLNNSVLNKQQIISKGHEILTLKVMIRKNTGHISANLAEDIMQIISDLIGFVYGDKISWIRSIGYKNGSETFNSLRDVAYSKLNPFRQLINLNYSHNLTNYITMVFPKYTGIHPNLRKSLKVMSDGLQFSAERLVFPAPIVTLASTIEDFANTFLPETTTQYITKGERRKLDSSFIQWITHNIIPQLKEQDKLDFNDASIKQKHSALIQRSLNSRIRSLLENSNIEYDPSWASDFVKKRNDAVHGGYEFEEEDYLIWTRMVSMMEKILLKELDFKGEYIDWSELRPVSKIFNSNPL